MTIKLRSNLFDVGPPKKYVIHHILLLNAHVETSFPAFVGPRTGDNRASFRGPIWCCGICSLHHMISLVHMKSSKYNEHFAGSDCNWSKVGSHDRCPMRPWLMERTIASCSIAFAML